MSLAAAMNLLSRTASSVPMTQTGDVCSIVLNRDIFATCSSLSVQADVDIDLAIDVLAGVNKAICKPVGIDVFVTMEHDICAGNVELDVDILTLPGIHPDLELRAWLQLCGLIAVDASLDVGGVVGSTAKKVGNLLGGREAAADLVERNVAPWTPPSKCMKKFKTACGKSLFNKPGRTTCSAPGWQTCLTACQNDAMAQCQSSGKRMECIAISLDTFRKSDNCHYWVQEHDVGAIVNIDMDANVDVLVGSLVVASVDLDPTTVV